MKDLTLIDQDDDLLATRSLPRLLAALPVSTTKHPGQPARYHIQGMGALPEGQRAVAQDLLRRARDLTDPQSIYGLRLGDHPMMKKEELVLKLLAAFSIGENSELKEAARLDFYNDAVREMPWWALDAAIKAWNQRKCPRHIEKEPRYSFAPSPATLYGMCVEQLLNVRRTADRCDVLLKCVSEKDALNPDQRPLAPSTKQPLLRKM